MAKKLEDERTYTILVETTSSVKNQLVYVRLALTTHKRHDMFVYLSPS